MANGGGVQSYEEAKKTATTKVKIPKDGEKSNFSGYGDSKTAKSYFDTNVEGMKSIYTKHKEKGDPSAEELSKRLGESDEEAAGILNKATQKEHAGTMGLYKLRQEAGLSGYKKGGKIKRSTTKKKK